MSLSDSRSSPPPAMIVCRDDAPVPAELEGAVTAIGNFDGVHRGHQRLIETVRRQGRQGGRPAAVLTFEPHPRRVFRPDEPLFRLTPEPVKLAVLARLGLDGVLLRRFDAAFAQLSAEAFVTWLRTDRQISGLVVGEDFHCGRGREGTPARLQELCGRHGLTCTFVPAVREGEEAVSSSAVRAALRAGDIDRANQLLGYRWFVRAAVSHGEKRGRTLGFPTANLRLGEECGLRHGIYAVRAALGRGIVQDGVASFGRRPTFDNGVALLEVFLFDFSGDLYGRELDVEFAGWIRPEEHFDGVDALVARMHEDARAARQVLARAGARSLIG